ncbi:hypothetical protein GCM10009799_22080 [Nocardiopsis rhodophaea]|uniref:HTH IS21-type domain-containing protein n=1 Tax=Nocardiopsis rhodophaea TaxID=280238 RepID=A0ABN2SZI4_9ACTN
MPLGGRAGARLTSRLASAVSRMTLIRLIRQTPEPAPPVPRVLGVDDFALLKGHVYGTLLVDVATGHPVDLLAERSAPALVAWLHDHPGVEVVCRDRAGCYADGAARGAPEAVQVADRWHLWNNLAAAAERVVARHRGRLGHRPPPAGTAPPGEPPAEPADQQPCPPRQGRIAQRTRQRHAAVHDLRTEGRTIMEIARELGLARNTVRRFARAATAEELLAKDGTGKRPKIIQPFDAYLRRRFAQGCTNATVLWHEIRAMGYEGGRTSVSDHIRPWRQTALPPEPRPQPLSVREATAWITRHPDTLDEDERIALADVLARCPERERLSGHVARFAQLMADRRGYELEGWMRAAREKRIGELTSFVSGLRRDFDAVRAGLTLPYSSGVVEGHVNRLKMLKRQMYGRAKPDLLRKRVLLAA